MPPGWMLRAPAADRAPRRDRTWPVFQAGPRASKRDMARSYFAWRAWSSTVSYPRRAVSMLSARSASLMRRASGFPATRSTKAM